MGPELILPWLLTLGLYSMLLTLPFSVLFLHNRRDHICLAPFFTGVTKSLPRIGEQYRHCSVCSFSSPGLSGVLEKSVCILVQSLALDSFYPVTLCFEHTRTGGSTPLLCLEGVPDLPVAPQDEAGLTKTFQTWPRGWFHIP